MELNYPIVLVGAILGMAVGVLWYGPLFGKLWLSVVGATADDLEKRKEMQRRALPLYVVQFLLTILQLVILLRFVKGWEEADGVTIAFTIWLAFVMPTLAGSAMWNNNSAKVKWTMFLLQAGYQLVMFIIFGWLLGEWGYTYE